MRKRRNRKRRRRGEGALNWKVAQRYKKHATLRIHATLPPQSYERVLFERIRVSARWVHTTVTNGSNAQITCSEGGEGRGRGEGEGGGGVNERDVPSFVLLPYATA